MKLALTFPALLQAFFTDRLIAQRNASAHTIAAYRDTFRLLFNYVREQLDKAPSLTTLSEIEKTAHGVVTPAWLPFTRSSTMLPISFPNTARSSNGFWRFPERSMSVPW